MKPPHLIENNLIECSYVEKRTDGKVPRIRRGAPLCQECSRDSCEFKPKEEPEILKVSPGLVRNPIFQATVKKMLRSGYSQSRIAKKLKVSRETVRRILKS